MMYFGISTTVTLLIDDMTYLVFTANYLDQCFTHPALVTLALNPYSAHEGHKLLAEVFMC